MEPTLQPTANTEHAWYRALYKEHRNPFVLWAQQRFHVEDEEAHDAFQEAVIVLYRKSSDGGLAELNCSVRTYLFAVGKNQLLNRMRVMQKQAVLPDEFDGILAVDPGTNYMDGQDKEATAELVRQRLAELRSDDRRVLELYYLEGNDMDAVAEAMGLKNRNVAKKKKYYALQRLIALVRVVKMLVL
ncbi:MAG: sigma-70 family RNA polymerase sigma factor [Flavobacteriales bacterium]